MSLYNHPIRSATGGIDQIAGVGYYTAAMQPQRNVCGSGANWLKMHEMSCYEKEEKFFFFLPLIAALC